MYKRQLVDNHIITIADLKNVLDMRDGETDIIMTGISLEDDVCALADYCLLYTSSHQCMQPSLYRLLGC